MQIRFERKLGFVIVHYLDIRGTDWLFSEADFLLNNALRKLVLDNDVDTAVSLLKLSDETLAKVNNSQSAAIRSAINQDLKQLLSVAGVDQNAVMQKLSQLANTVDELPVLDVNFGDDQNATKLSDSLSDWAENAEKSATSFLNHFIRISPKHVPVHRRVQRRGDRFGAGPVLQDR